MGLASNDGKGSGKDSSGVPRVNDSEQPEVASASTESSPQAPQSAPARFMGKVSSMAKGVAAPAVAVTSRIALAMGVPTKAVGIAMAVILTAGGVAGFNFIKGPSENQMLTQYWVGDDDCEDYISQAMQSDSSGTEQSLPSTCECHGNKIGWYGTREFDLTNPRTPTGMTSPYGFPDGSSQATVQDVWCDKGGEHDEQGFCKLDGCYLIACTSLYGEIGDVITFKFGDGSTIDCVKIDAKAEEVCPWDPTPASKYGHDNCQCVLEFCGEDRIGDEPLSTLGKTNLGVTGYTNHGMHPDVAAKAGSAGGATANMNGLGNDKAADAVEECGAEKPVTASTLAECFASFSYSSSVAKSGDQWLGSPVWDDVWNAAKGSIVYYRMCCCGVWGGMIWAGAADPAQAIAGPSGVYEYMQADPDWEEVTGWSGGAEGLEPGDVVSSSDDSHIFAFVGKEAATQAYEKVIKGTEADTGEWDPESEWMTSSNCCNGCTASTSREAGHDGGKAPGLYAGENSHNPPLYHAFHYKGDYHWRKESAWKERFENVGTKVNLKNTSVKGTDCECLECDDDEKEPDTSDIIELARTALGASYVYGGGHTTESMKDPKTDDGRDCSGFVSWCYWQAWGIAPDGEDGPVCTATIESAIGTLWKEIPASEGRAGDILNRDGGIDCAHVMLYGGKNDAGNDFVIHSHGPVTEDEINLEETMASGYKLLRWIGPGAKDTNTKSTKKSSNTGTECKENCFSGTDFSDSVIIGDSVTYGAKTAIADTLTGIKIDGEANRTFEQGGKGDEDHMGDEDYGGIDVARKYKGKYDRYVIEIGINDCGTTYDMCKEFVKVLGGKSNVQIFFVNQYVASYPEGNDLTNESIDKICSEYNNVFKVDWAGVAKDHESEYLSDGCHLTDEGAKKFAETIKDAMAKNGGCDSSSSSSSSSGNAGSVGDALDITITDADVNEWAKRIDSFLAGRPMAGLGKVFAKAAAKYGIDPRLGPAQCVIETGGGQANGFGLPYNAFGIRGGSYSSWEEAIEAHAKLVSGPPYHKPFTREDAATYCDESYWDTLAPMAEKVGRGEPA